MAQNYLLLRSLLFNGCGDLEVTLMVEVDNCLSTVMTKVKTLELCREKQLALKGYIILHGSGRRSILFLRSEQLMTNSEIFISSLEQFKWPSIIWNSYPGILWIHVFLWLNTLLIEYFGFHLLIEKSHFSWRALILQIQLGYRL